MPLPRAAPVTPTAAERTTLNKAPGARGQRTGIGCGPQIVLAVARGRDNARIAADLQVNADTVRGRPRRISELNRAAVVALVCQLPAATSIPLSPTPG